MSNFSILYFQHVSFIFFNHFTSYFYHFLLYQTDIRVIEWSLSRQILICKLLTTLHTTKILNFTLWMHMSSRPCCNYFGEEWLMPPGGPQSYCMFTEILNSTRSWSGELVVAHFKRQKVFSQPCGISASQRSYSLPTHFYSC